MPNTVHFTLVNGSWSSWNIWSSCNKSCDGGYQSKFRTCSSPPSSHGGVQCLMGDKVSRGENETMVQMCNMEECSSEYFQNYILLQCPKTRHFEFFLVYGKKYKLEHYM